ncbi:MAG: DegT/DnrJ/EryC1/StrS family aminotransferase, partial [Candidatus Omnitrophica bacterium]|nr:DegT/DnrJ/EryC1/StrS family aminotransferase [Candidatus Omnitrophota bacterium]
GQLVGGCGTIGVFSFYATKMICAGEGGMVISHNSKLLKFIRDRRDYDHKEDLHVRFNYKMTDLQAGLGITQLKKIKAFIQKRRQIAAFYNKHLNDLDVGLPKTRQGNEHIYFRYVIRLKKNCDRFLKNLQQNGVDARRPVYKPIHMYFKNIYCPQTTELYQKSISIPIYPSLTQKQMHFIVKQLKKNLI